MARANGKRAVAAVLGFFGFITLPIGVGAILLYVSWKVYKQAKAAERRAEKREQVLDQQLVQE